MMAHLQDLLLKAEARPNVVKDCVALVEDEVGKKGGLTGIAVKGAYAIVKKIKPGIVSELCEKLVEPFAEKLDPLYQQYGALKSGAGVESYFKNNASAVAQALLAITDERAKKSENRTLRSVYDRLRPSGVKHVEAAAAGIGAVIDRHVPKIV